MRIKMLSDMSRYNDTVPPPPPSADCMTDPPRLALKQVVHTFTYITSYSITKNHFPVVHLKTNIAFASTKSE